MTSSTGLRHSAALVALSALWLTGCGLAETTAVAGAQGASAAEQAKQARETEAKVQQKLDEAQRVAAEQRAAAERASE